MPTADLSLLILYIIDRAPKELSKFSLFKPFHSWDTELQFSFNSIVPLVEPNFVSIYPLIGLT